MPPCTRDLGINHLEAWKWRAYIFVGEKKIIIIAGKKRLTIIGIRFI